jgi:hypothetical protein
LTEKQMLKVMLEVSRNYHTRRLAQQHPVVPPALSVGGRCSISKRLQTWTKVEEDFIPWKA